MVPFGCRAGERGSPEEAGILLLCWKRNQRGQAGGGEVVPFGRRSGERGSPEDAGILLFLGRRNQGCLLYTSLIELARKRIGFVLCESYRPAVLLLPADRATDTALSVSYTHLR